MLLNDIHMSMRGTRKLVRETSSSLVMIFIILFIDLEKWVHHYLGGRSNLQGSLPILSTIWFWTKVYKESSTRSICSYCLWICAVFSSLVMLWACLVARKWAKVRKWRSMIAHFPIYPNTGKEKWENPFSFLFSLLQNHFLTFRVL